MYDLPVTSIIMERMDHRGPDRWGGFSAPGIRLMQNYLIADIGPGYDDVAVPAQDSCASPAAVCMDGRISVPEHLYRNFEVEEGPLRDERLLLSLYRHEGSRLLNHLDSSSFALVLAESEGGFLAARGRLGIKTLYYGRKNGAVYFGSELKSLAAVTDDVHEFPPGHYMNEDQRLTPFAGLPDSPPAPIITDEEKATTTIRRILEKNVENRVTFRRPAGCLLSGGIDSSIIARLASRQLEKLHGPTVRLKTFVFGIGESEDILAARRVAEVLGTEHHEVTVSPEEALEAISEVIYCLESFDPSLVRSAVSNFIISRYAAEGGIEVLLSGEGADEIFCGYRHLKKTEPEALFDEQITCLKALHNNAALRLDRTNRYHGIRVVAPFISGDLLNLGLSLAPELKMRKTGTGVIEKWILRKTFENDLPEDVVWRIKKEFSQGSGPADLFPEHFESLITDTELEEEQEHNPVIVTKEELYYYRLFTRFFGNGPAIDTVGRWKHT